MISKPSDQLTLGLSEEFRSTAIYPNRQANKAKVEASTGWAEQGNQTTEFYTPQGTLFAVGYRRIVYGDHGPYVEFSRDQIRCTLVQRFPKVCPPHAFYEWLCPQGEPTVKVYDQRRSVSKLPNPPQGGFRGNRKEGYADYIVGLLYVSPSELRNKKS